MTSGRRSSSMRWLRRRRRSAGTGRKGAKGGRPPKGGGKGGKGGWLSGKGGAAETGQWDMSQVVCLWCHQK